MADRVILLNAGRIEQNGTPVELYERPANAFVARFIGTPPMNLLRARARRRRRGDRGHRGARRAAAGLRAAACSACARSTSRSASSAASRAAVEARRVPRRRFAARPAASADSRSPCARRAASGSRRGDAAWLDVGARVPSISSRRTARATMSTRVARAATMTGVESTFHTRRKHRWCNRFVAQRRGGARARWRCSLAAGARAGADRGLVLLPGRRRRPDHQDHRRLSPPTSRRRIPASS